MKLLLAGAIVMIVVYWSFQDWRRAVKAVFFILVFDGALRKWVLPQASEFIYFFKDFVLLGAYLRYFFYAPPGDRFPIRNNLITILILTASGWCIFQAFNPYLGSPIVGILGIKSYLFYIPMIWMAPSLFRSEEELYTFLRNHLFLLIPIGILGIVQFFSPVHSPINQYIPGRNEPIATFGFAGSRNVRITSTFSYLNSYQGYLSACFGLLIPLVSFPKTLSWQLLIYCEVFLISLNSFMTGSRTPVIAAILFSIGYFGIRLIRKPELMLVWIVRILPFGLVTLSVMFIAFRKVVEAFWERVSSNEDLAERISYSFVGPLDLIDLTGFDGFGVGATHAGTLSLRLALGLPYPPPLPVELEPEMARVALELGPIGFSLWYGMRLAIIGGLFLVFLQLRRPFLRDLALAGALMQTVLLTNHMVFHNSFGPYYWLYTSFLYVLPWIERVEQWRSHNEWHQQQSLANGETAHATGSDAPDG
ncbi:MAG: hypothetical protein AAGG51_10095 [Cyanobacteria bacterium P01_G01_bin.54]